MIETQGITDTSIGADPAFGLPDLNMDGVLRVLSNLEEIQVPDLGGNGHAKGSIGATSNAETAADPADPGFDPDDAGGDITFDDLAAMDADGRPRLDFHHGPGSGRNTGAST